MLKKAIRQILEESRPYGWVLEPDAKRILKLSGIPVPAGKVVQSARQAVAAGRKLGFPVVAKAVGVTLVHKSDAGAVILPIGDESRLEQAYHHLAGIDGCQAVLVETMGQGLEMIVGGKVDAQFGPVILLGVGGTGVEIYQDTALRMAPLKHHDVNSMINNLRARELLTGFRGSQPVNLEALAELMLNFSKLLVKMADQIESIDLNPVLCNPEGCLVADARIILGNIPAIDASSPETDTSCKRPSNRA